MLSIPSPRRDSLSCAKAKCETALYISRLSGELSLLAKRARLDMVAYCLDMATLEANSAAFDDQSS